MLFKRLADVGELFEGFRLIFRQCFFDAFRCASTGNHVFALSVDQIITAKAGDSDRTISRQTNAGCTVFPKISKDHRLHIGGRPPFMRDVIHTPIDHCAVVHPASKDSTNAAPKLFHWVFRKIDACFVLNDIFEVHDDLTDRFHTQILFVLRTFLFAGLFQDVFEVIRVVLVFRLQAQNHIAIHLNQTTVAVPREVFISGLFDESLDDFFVDADVQDRIHHAGHRLTSTRSAGQQQRVRRVSVLFAHAGFGSRDGGIDLIFQFRRIGTIVVVKVGTDFSCDREAGRNRQTDAAHFRQVGSFAAEQFFLSCVAVCFAITKCIDVLFRHCFSC